ncbi:ATP-binding protein [Archangium sp. Cb G35]|uniref:ATP-binding protein n=1 Tax=Archangium sp. Cb G35 TaxID=1920190 RepID=UPI0009F92706|nr:ATP-binding protein [Archangium sp. Cb G35]
MADDKNPKSPGTGVPPTGSTRPASPSNPAKTPAPPATTAPRNVPARPAAPSGSNVARPSAPASQTPGQGTPSPSGSGPARGVPERPSQPAPAKAGAPPAADATRGERARPTTPVEQKAPPVPEKDVAANEIVRELPEDVFGAFEELQQDANRVNEKLDPELEQAVGFTHFDSGSSQDNLVTVLMTRDDLHKLASQTLVRVKSKEDKRKYLGLVVRGPFAEPDAVSASSTIAVGVVVQGKKLTYTFDYHGRAEIEILGEELEGGKLVPPGRRPRPKSPVFLLDEAESERVLGMKGNLCLGMVVGYKNMEARFDPMDKSVLPRHTGIIGTTGGGKSTTVATLIHRAQKAGIATIVFDVEGEYTHVDKPTDDPAMGEALRRRKQQPEGVKELHIHHLMGRDSRNPRHRNLHPFALNFSSLSPYAISEILGLSEAQQERFHKAYDVTKLLLEELGIYPRTAEERQQVLELDELSTGYPRMTIQHLLDVVSTYIYSLSDEGKAETRSRSKSSSRKASSASESGEGAEAEEPVQPSIPPLYSEFKHHFGRVMGRVMAHASRNEISWKALASKLHSLRRLKLFDVGSAPGVDYGSMLTPGRVSVIDLSDTDSPQLNNLVIADILRGLQETQEARYQRASEQGQSVTPVLIIIEEAHEFLSASRISQMPVLFEQVARIAKRGRKRWLGLVFVTQLPQHLPSEVLGLLNNFIIHKITDSAVISRMQKTAGTIDESLWNKVSSLAPGQALVSFSSFTRPLMVAVDPAPVKRLLVE